MKKAFSLIELMIVIVIIGVVYTLAVTQVKSVKEQKMQPSFLNLKEYLSSFIKDDARSARLLCLDECKDCGVYVDDAKVLSFESFFDESVRLYRYDFLLGVQSVQKAVYFNEEDVQEDVCFSFKMYKNNISEQLILTYEERVYDYSTYFDKTPVYESLDALSQAKESLVQEVLR